MDIGLESTWIVTLLLVALRLAPLFINTPLDIMGKLPGNIRFLMLLSIAFLLTLGMDLSIPETPSSMVMLTKLALIELGYGAAMAFGFYASFAAFSMGGRLLDFQMGFGAASIFDPATNQQNPLMGTIFLMLSLVIFFSTDAIHYVIRGLAFSFESVPVGLGVWEIQYAHIIKMFGYLFVYGVMLVAPIIAVLLLLDVGVGVMARTMPQMNVYFLFLPLKIFTGLLLTAIVLKYLMPLFEEIHMLTFRYWAAIL